MTTCSKKWTFKEFMKESLLRKTIGKKEKRNKLLVFPNKTFLQASNSPKRFERRKSQLLFSQSSYSTSFAPQKNSTSKSFDGFMSLLTTPENSLATVVPNPEKYFRKKRSSVKSEEVLSRNNSFEQKLDSLVKTKPSCSNSQSQSSMKQKDFVFEKFMNSVLTPNWHESSSQNTQFPSQKAITHEPSSQNTQFSSQKAITHESSSQNTQFSSQKANTFTQNKNSSSLNKMEVDADVEVDDRQEQENFNQLLINYHSMRLSQNAIAMVPNVTTSQEFITVAPSQISEVDCKKEQCDFNKVLIKTLSQRSKDDNENLVNENSAIIPDNTFNLCTDAESEMYAVPLKESEETNDSFVSEPDIEIKQCNQSTIEIEQQSFDNKLCGAFSQNSPILQNESRENFTHTSCDASLPQSSVLLNVSEELNVFSQMPKTVAGLSQQIESANLSQRRESSKRIKRNNINNNEVVNPEEHVLRDLSEDIVFLSDGRKIFSRIDKIGTDKWLQKAFETAPNIATNKYTPQQDIFECENLKSFYVDYLTKVTVHRYTDSNTKVCEIKDQPNVSNDFEDPEIIHFNWNIEVTEDIEETQFAKQLRVGIDRICQDPILVRSDCNLERIDKSKIQMKIHNIFAKVYDAFENNRMPCLVVPQDRRGSGKMKIKVIRYKTITSRRPFCRLLFILAKIYTLIQTNRKLTKREIYYQVKHVCMNQGVTNYAIELASRILGVGHWHFNIISQSGLVYGDLKLLWSSGETTNCNAPATLVPYDMEDLVEVRSNAYFILIVEKESIFHLLLEEDLPNKLARPFVLVTGKGMPSINTRLFVNRLSRLLALPVFILCDADVYGIRIMLTYRFGAFANEHLYDDLALPNARWLGVFPSEIVKYNLKNQTLSKTDKRVIDSLLNYPYLEQLPEIGGEVSLLLIQNMKASIEALILSDNFLSKSYLPLKFYNQDYL